MTSDINRERITYEGIVYSIFFLIATFLVNITYQVLKDSSCDCSIVTINIKVNNNVFIYNITQTYLVISILMIFLGMSLLFAKFYVKIRRIEYCALTQHPYSALPPTFLDTTIILSLVLIAITNVSLSTTYRLIIYFTIFVSILICFSLLFTKIEKRQTRDSIVTKFFIIILIAIAIACIASCRIISSNKITSIDIIILTFYIFSARFIPEILIE